MATLSPYISVIMPVYNAEKYVHQAIESILNQSFGNFELLIFNDCSTDKSKEIILSFNDPRIQLIDSPENTGYVKHLNHGLEMAKGKYIARMDADDISMPDRFQKQVEFLDRHEEVAVCGTFIEFIGSKKGLVDFPIVHCDIITHFLLHGNGMAHPSVMMRKSILNAYSISYNRSLEPAEDYDLWNRISAYGQLHNIPEILLQYRVHDANESVLKKDIQDKAVRIIREQIIARWTKGAEKKIVDMLSHKSSYETISDNELKAFSTFTVTLVKSGLFNSSTLRVKLSPIFVLYCKHARISSFKKVLYYIRFPKDVFSIRTTLSFLVKV